MFPNNIILFCYHYSPMAFPLEHPSWTVLGFSGLSNVHSAHKSASFKNNFGTLEKDFLGGILYNNIKTKAWNKIDIH